MIGQRALELGFSSTIGIIHDGSGQLKPLGDDERSVYDEMTQLQEDATTRASTTFRKPSPTASPTTGAAAPAHATSTSARTGWCTTAASSAAIPACRSPSTPRADVKREFLTEKSCAPNCTICCVHQVSYIDHWRAPQTTTVSPGPGGLVQIQPAD